MTKNQVTSRCNQFLANNELLKAMNVILEYLQDKDSHIESKISNLKNEFSRLEELNINQPVVNYAEQIAKIKNSIYFYIKDLPEFKDAGTPSSAAINAPSNSGDPSSLWAFIWKLIKNPISILIIVGVILILYVAIRLTGRDPLCLIFNDCNSKTTVNDILNDKIKIDSFTEKAILAGKDYIIDDLTMIVDYENEGNCNIAKWTTVYNIRALKKLEKIPFPETYFSSYVDTIKHVFGNNIEELKGDGRSYNIFLTMEKDEKKTIITGSNFKYKLPLKLNRVVSQNDEKLNSNEEGYMYNNQDGGDFIKNLNVIIKSNTLAINPIFKGARRYSKNNQIEKEEAFQNFDKQNFTNSSNRSISYSWKELTNADNVAIYFKW